MTKDTKLFEGRFSEDPSEIFSLFVDSISFDIVLLPFDIKVSKAHANMLKEIGLIDEPTKNEILDGLNIIWTEYESGEFQKALKPGDEDVHSAIERRLTELKGDAGRALHTGRSRNDLAQMSGRLYCVFIIDEISNELKNMITTLAELASKNISLMMPGKTHLQHAQPILVSHWLLSHAFRLKNDIERLMQTRKRVNVCVLGSGALAGSTLNLDANIIAKELKCDSIVPNSIFGVSTRDYILETLFDLSNIMINLSCLGEDVVWATSTECDYATLDDRFSSGSSMMPQKKNPDIAELIRGKAGLSIGQLTAVLAMAKSQVFGYNHDLQVDKEALFASHKDCRIGIVAMNAMMATISFNENALNESLKNQPLLLATDIAEQMVKEGIPFRIAYKQVASAIRSAMDRGLGAKELVEELKNIEEIESSATKIFGSDILEAMRRSINSRNTIGGTSTESVLEQIKLLKHNQN